MYGSEVILEELNLSKRIVGEQKSLLLSIVDNWWLGSSPNFAFDISEFKQIH